MTGITVYFNGESIEGFKARGHSGYAESGSDIVCAAVSALTQTAYLGLEKYLEKAPDIIRKDGELRLFLPKDLTPEDREKAQLILGTMLSGLRSIEEKYSDYLKIIKKEV